MNVVHTSIEEHHVCFDLEIQSAGRLPSICFNCIRYLPHTSTIKHAGRSVCVHGGTIYIHSVVRQGIPLSLNINQKSKSSLSRHLLDQITSLMNSICSALTNIELYSLLVAAYVCPCSLRDKLIVPQEWLARMKFQGESEFFCLNNRSVHRVERRHKASTLLSLHLIESIVSGYYHACLPNVFVPIYREWRRTEVTRQHPICSIDQRRRRHRQIPSGTLKMSSFNKRSDFNRRPSLVNPINSSSESLSASALVEARAESD